MERVLLWGTGSVYKSRYTLLEELVASNYIEILALVNKEKEPQKLTPNKEHKIFSEYPDQWMGIGCLIQ